jgi:nanoRNase/pAp phosphatase (c-di-AMP/oligoRNAs hydrolase)
MYMQNSDQVRISARSNKCFGEPLALELAEKYQGGGHLCAAGFKLSVHKFKSQFTKIPCEKARLQISPE